MGKVWVCDDEPSARFPVFTRGNIGEVFGDAVSPLTWTTLGVWALERGWREGYYETGLFTEDEFKPLGQAEILACFGGYLYINMSVLRMVAVRVPGVSMEAIDRSAFGDYPDVPPYRPDPRDRNAERTAQMSAWLASLFTVDPLPPTDANQMRIDALRARQLDLASLTDAELLEHFRSHIDELRIVWKRHVLNSSGANVLTSLIGQICQGIGATALASKVTAALGEVDSARQSFELWDLSRIVQASIVLTAAFDQGIDNLLERLRSTDDPGVRNFLAQWDGFIGRWGFIGPSAYELRSPTYRSEPSIPLRMLDRARRAPDSSAPAVRAAAGAAEREVAIEEIARRLASAPDLRQQFLAAARSDSNYLAARERSKLHCAVVIDAARAPVRELGRRLVERGLLSRWEDVLLVTNAEADDFIVHPASYVALIRERAAQLRVLQSKEPPFVFEGAPPPLSAFKDRAGGEVEPAAGGAQLTGIGVSPGRYTGRAHVVTSLAADSELEPGEIIVAPITDASWGPLFVAAGAVVVETGAMISHAAIVARELGIPAVASLTGATRLIRNGTMITVDGSAGTVLVH
jgi:pyruvate,water dikinase